MRSLKDDKVYRGRVALYVILSLSSLFILFAPELGLNKSIISACKFLAAVLFGAWVPLDNDASF